MSQQSGLVFKFILMEGGAHGGESTLAGLLLTLGTPAAVVVAVVAGFCLAKFQPTSQKRNLIESDQEPGSRMVRVRRSASDNECPICMDPAKFAVETNCGHMYCSKCIIQNWRTNFTMSPMSCPFCRQEVTILLPCFSEGETNTAELPEIQDREKQMSDIREYNRMYSQHPRSLYGQLQDLPTLLRHIWAELFTWRGVEMISRFRVLICLISAIIYAITPIDLIPEAFVGLIGLIDDVIVIAFLLIQVTVVYRTVVANRDW
ncbi:E3 ubiquitin-protein ligase RNF170-like isoform X1 [Penaeus japonicus]|uniref:E3 ubiquitin-protein ligase RNF170-like isoform X1 n=1 Tax=Penaeus japonicus TaxID=27405 RepID=UPI001C711C08|nr:E3 ubiquitin-protein ligase RNF170-like isoform X1 [Penaeus japonicus]